MNEQSIIEKVNTALAEEFELDEALLLPSAHIRDDLGLDSLDIVDMIIVLEKAFAFKIPDRESMRSIQTLGDIYAFISSMRDLGVVQDTH